MGDSSWVTQALEEENVVKAVVLGKSLRSVLTRHKLVVVVNPTITLASRDALESTFDYVLSLDSGKCGYLLNNTKISADILAKAFALSFTFFKQCIFLPPNSLVLKNCDNAFSQAENHITKTKQPAVGADEGGKTDFLYFQPTSDAFKKLSAFISCACKENQKKAVHADSLFAKWVQNQPVPTVMQLAEPNFVRVKLGENRFLQNDENVAVCHLVDLPREAGSKYPEQNGYFPNAGLLEKFIYGRWVKMCQEVKSSSIESLSTYETIRNGQEPIAVVGMSCRYPSSNSISEFWNLLIEARDGIRTPPENRWTKEQSITHNPETSKTQAGFLTVPVDEFDAKFFGISPKEIVFIDPQHRLLHELVWEALENGGINPHSLYGSSTGVFMGSWRNDYQDILQRSQSREFYRGYMGNSIGAGAARISHFLGLTGPCVATESGCSAAMVAVHIACRSLQSGESSMALACGVNLLLHPFTTDIMPMVTAADGHCKTFSDDANGFGRAEGSGVLVLKRLSDAVKDGDSILGVIRGSAIAQEGISKSMGTPTVHCEAQAMRHALRDANVHPSQISYVESHGTGTIVGDPMEVAAIGRVYSEGRQEPLIIGSVKTNVGHTESCSGITAIMKVILSMEHQVIPPHRNFKELNPDINLDIIPAKLPLEPVNWPKIPGKPRYAGISSFGITGTDGHVIIQDSPEHSGQRIVLPEFERPLHLLTVSAKTEEALDILLEKYKAALSSDAILPDDAFANMAYTSNVGRAKFNYRAAILAKDTDQAFKILDSNKTIRGEVDGDENGKKICFLFTGQGSQYHGMARELYQTSPVFKMNFDHCEKFLKSKFKISLATAFWGQDEELVNRSLYSQTGIFVVEYCLLKLWESWGIKPDFVLGHSLGEFGAATCAGILTLEEALTLVATRSQLIDALPQGKMLVVKADKTNVDKLVNKFTQENSTFWLDYAAVNSPEQTVLAGDTDNVVKFAEWLKGKDVKCSILQSSHAFHSRHMDPMLTEYRAVAEKIFQGKTISDLNCSFVSGVLGKILDVSTVSTIDWPNYWVQHTREKVNYLAASRSICEQGECRLFVEIGPHPVLTALTMLNNEDKSLVCLPTLRRQDTDWRSMLTSLSKLFVSGAVEIDWNHFDQFYAREKVGKLLPTYPFMGTKYWPSITSSTGVQIHPLLGSSIPNPTKAKIFQSSISLQNLDYLKDHVIGQRIVMPGAGYMETLLMAGHATLDSTISEFTQPRRPVQLENFRIEAPLGLEEGSSCTCQTVVEWTNSDDNGVAGLNVKFYHELTEQDGGSSKWISHASARFSPYNSSSDNGSVELADKQQYLETISRLKSTGKEENCAKEFYDKVAEVGLKFGPTFRTLSKIWRNGEEKSREFLAQVKIPKDASNYILHPTLIDAMIQCTVFHGEENKKIEKKLQVPIGCQKFVWLRALPEDASQEEGEEPICYIYSTEKSSTIILLDCFGNPVALLAKLETIETNAKSVQAMLETQVKAVPDMYKTEWKSTLGPCQKRLEFSLIKDLVHVTEAEPQDSSDYSESRLELRRGMHALVTNNILLAFQNLGWNPKLGDTLNPDQLCAEFEIQPQHKLLVNQFLSYLTQDGILEQTGDHWKVVKLPENVTSLQKASAEIVDRLLHTHSADQALLLQMVGEKLDKFLTGKESPLRVLFPEDESKPSAGKFYASRFKYFSHMLSKSLCKTWHGLREAYEQPGKPLPVLRLLEVGAGTGTATQAILDSLDSSGMQYEYHFTDISAAFFSTAEKRFKNKNIKYRKLNLEQDATCQGFAPDYFDFVFAVQVIHATRDVKESLLNIRQLLKSSGNFLQIEMISNAREVDCIFGLLDGYWRFTDYELRQNHAILPADKWELVGRQTGYSKMAYGHEFEMAIISYRADNGEMSYEQMAAALNPECQQIQKQGQVAWLLFYGSEEEKYAGELQKKLEMLGRKKVILVKNTECEDIETVVKLASQPCEEYSCLEGVLTMWGLGSQVRDQAQLAKPFLQLVQGIMKLEKKLLPQVVVLTAGQLPVGDILCPNPSASTLIGITKCVANEVTDLRIRAIDVNPEEMFSSLDETVQEIFTGFNDEVGPLCAFRDRERFIPRVLPDKSAGKSGALPLPSSTQRFQLIHPPSKSIHDLEFGDLEEFSLKPNEIEVQVKCSALNFKDVLNVLKPIDEFKDSNGVGFDFAGVVTAVGEGVTLRQVGEPVFGINIMGNALPSHIKLPEDAVVPIPDFCTFAEAACFPAVFSTAYYCMINIAQAKRGETILLHAASGGVGLLAIQLAKYFGLHVICTAGSQRKRAYLRSLGIQHVFHSRNTKYEKQIMEATNGRGVDIVLNSLTGPGFKEATLAVCAPNARFVEMSKLTIWSVEEVRARRPDVGYTIIDLTTLDEESSRKLLAESRKLLEENVITAIPYTRFDATCIREALGYLQKAKHIGKVVCIMPEFSLKDGKVEVITPLFNNRSSYLITGGLGGIGFEVAKWMVTQGAKHIILAGRKAPKPDTARAIEALNASGSHIVVCQADVGDRQQVHKIMDLINNPESGLPKLRGIQHCAGTLADTLVENSKWQDFETTFQSKVSGSWNLHDLTKSCQLEHFVFYSSITSPMGAPGQATHVSACTFEDTMAHFRNASGLPATSINWGQFGQVGIASEVDIIFIRPFTPEQGINALDMIMRGNRNHLLVATFESALAGMVKYLPYSKKVIDEQVFKMTGSGDNSSKKLQMSSNQFWEEYNECKDDREAKVEVVRKFTKVLLRHVLRAEEDEPIDENTDLQDLGVDSLMMLELKNNLQEVLGDRVKITQSAMKDCTTVALLSDRLVQLIEEEGEFTVVQPPTLEQVRELVEADCKLPVDIKAQVPGSERLPSEIKVVLFIGATGVLGSHMLREILEECPQLEKVYCLIRTRGGQAPEEKLAKVLERSGLMQFMVNFEKVACISGNFIEDHLGLEQENYDKLVAEAHAVIHCGAKVNHVEYYRNVEGGRNDARSVNVKGLLKILEFCGSSKTKHLIQTSTLLAVNDINEMDCTLAESWPDLEKLTVVHNKGYQVSKYVCDLLLKQATEERGIPCKSFRYAELRGSLVTGTSMLESSHFMRSYLFFLKEGVMPDMPFAANFLPIDFAARITARIIFRDDAPNQAYNVSHPEPQLVQEYFPGLAQELGYSVAMLDVEEYRQRVLKRGDEAEAEGKKGEGALMAEFQELYKDEGFEESMHAVLSGSPSVKKFFENVPQFWKSKRLVELVPDLYRDIESSYEITKRDFLVGKKEGLFEKLGL